VKKNCKICSKKFSFKLSLGKHPCADTFLKNKNNAKNLRKIPLVVGYCGCSHLTALYPVPQKERYQKYDYSYTSDNSPVSRLHFKNIANQITKKYNLNSNKFVVEAGSNDGTFLKCIRNASRAKTLGVDPSINMNKLANRKKISTFTGFFNFETSKKVVKKFGKADILYGANVFNHIDDNLNFLVGAYNLLKNDGRLILEVPDLNSLVRSVGFDTIYHEHRHYYSEKSIHKILALKNFYVFKVEKINYMSGSLRIYASKKIVKKKRALSYVSKKEFLDFKKKILIVIKTIKKFVEQNKKNNQIVYGIGAATKGNTLLNCCSFSEKHIDYILEKSRHKINKYTPGSAIKIVDEKNYNYDGACIILPWNITKHLKKNFEKNKITKYTSIQKIIKSL